MILFSIHIYILFIILVKTKITIALPPKPLNATYSEHIIAVEMGYDDLLVTNDLSELFGDKDLLHDQEYHDEYGPNGWNFYCWYCKKEKIYCHYCYAGTAAATATDYYGSYYAEYYSRYYAYYYSSVLGDGFVDDVLGF